MAGIASLGAVAIAVPSAVPAPVAQHAPVALVAHVSAPPAPETPVAPTVLTGKDNEPIAILSAGPQGVQLVPVISDARLAAAPGDVTVQNAASDFITAAYEAIEPWVTYLVTDLTPWALGFIPFGWIIGDQIEIWYNALALPVADAFVYQFLNPVVNDPLNPAVWFNGFAAIGNAAITGVVDGLVSEVYWAWSLLPLPPLPPWPFAAAADAAVEDSQFRTMAFDESKTTDGEVIEEVVTDEVITEPVEDSEEPESDEQEQIDTDLGDEDGDLAEDEDLTDELTEDELTDEVTEDEVTEDEGTEVEDSTEDEAEAEAETEPEQEAETETPNEPETNPGDGNTDTSDNNTGHNDTGDTDTANNGSDN